MTLPKLSEQDHNWYILKGYEITEHVSARIWYLDGVVHRDDGPAIEYTNRPHSWYLNGIKISPEQHRIAVSEI